MTEVILAIHLMIAAALVAVVLLQRSEGGGLGIGGGGSGGGGIYVCPRNCQSIDAGYSDFGCMFFCYKFVISNNCDSGRQNL